LDFPLAGKSNGGPHRRNSDHARSASEDRQVTALLHRPPHFFRVLDHKATEEIDDYYFASDDQI
jgi:hypothetical protein